MLKFPLKKYSIKLKIIIYFIFIIFIFDKNVYSQSKSYSFKRFTVNEGLSNNYINCILQSYDGYLWIATKDGLSRYDGRSFINYRSNINDSTSLSSNYVEYLYELSDSSLLIGLLGGGLCKYDRLSNSFSKIDSRFNFDDFVNCIYEDKNKNIWYGTQEGGLIKLDPSNNKLTIYNSEKYANYYFPDNFITSIIEDSQNNLWIGTLKNGLVKLNPKNNETKIFLHSIDSNSISNNYVLNLNYLKSKTGENSILISTDFGFDRFEIETEKFTYLPNISIKNNPLFSTTIKQTLIDSENRLFIAGFNYSGLFVINNFNNKEFSELLHFKNEDDDPNSISTDRIRFIFEDSKNNIWIGTENGLNKLPATKDFYQFKHYPKRINSVSGRITSSFVKDKLGNLWVGYGGGGIDKINLKNFSIKHITEDLKNPNSLSSIDIAHLFLDDENILWIATSNDGLNSYDEKKNKFTHYQKNNNSKNSITSNFIQEILQIDKNRLLIATNHSLELFDKERKIFTPFIKTIDPNFTNLPNVFTTNTLYKDKNEKIWVGTSQFGLLSFNLQNNKIEQHLADNKNKFSISSNNVTSIFEDLNGNFWIGTYSGGLNKFNESTKQFQKFTTFNGLPSDVIFGILEDNKNNLWISTLKGIVKYDQNRNYFRTYDVNDGIVHNQFNWRANLKDDAGKMFFGGINGFISFYPDSITIDYDAPKPTVTSIKIFNKEVKFDKNNPIELDYDQNFFSIDFIALDLTSQEKYTYEYKLEGLNSNWINSGKNLTANFTNVDAGEYKFLVKTSNADGIWGEPTTILIKIHPAWWETIWFKSLIFILFILLFYFVYQFRIKQIIEIERIRYNISADLHDEIISNISSISVDSQAILQNKNLSSLEKELTTDIFKTSKETIDAIRDIIWFINPKNDDIEDMFLKMREIASKILIGLKWNFESDPDLKLYHFGLEIRKNLLLIYKEALTNIVKHSYATECNIQIKKSSRKLILQISDNGFGFDKINVKHNNGLKNMEFRAHKLNAKLEINSTIGNGTKLELTLSI